MQFGRSREAIARCLKGPDFEKLAEEIRQEAAESARNILRPHQIRAATLWATKAIDVAADKGNHRPAKQLLEATGVIRQRDDDDNRVIVQIGVRFDLDDEPAPRSSTVI